MTTWLKVADAAEHAKISADLIRQAVKDGDLPAYAVGRGRDYRLTAEDVDGWLKSKSWEPRSA